MPGGHGQRAELYPGTLASLQALRDAGCPVEGVRHGRHHGQPLEPVGADGLIDSLDPLTEGMAPVRRARPLGAS